MPEERVIDRETYRKIKKMSREELQAFLMRYSENLLEDNGGKVVDMSSLHSEIGQIKGFGEKRLDEIMIVIEKHLGI